MVTLRAPGQNQPGLRVEEAISFILIGIQDTTRKTPKTTWRQKTRHSSSPTASLAWSGDEVGGDSWGD